MRTSERPSRMRVSGRRDRGVPIPKGIQYGWRVEIERFGIKKLAL